MAPAQRLDLEANRVEPGTELDALLAAAVSSPELARQLPGLVDRQRELAEPPAARDCRGSIA
jgi:hypothetical protein